MLSACGSIDSLSVISDSLAMFQMHAFAVLKPQLVVCVLSNQSMGNERMLSSQRPPLTLMGSRSIQLEHGHNHWLHILCHVNLCLATAKVAPLAEAEVRSAKYPCTSCGWTRTWQTTCFSSCILSAIHAAGTRALYTPCYWDSCELHQVLCSLKVLWHALKLVK